MFKESFKHYKSRFPIPDFKDVIDFDVENSLVTQKKLSLNEANGIADHLLGVKPIRTWQCFTLVNHPGLLVIRNPFTTHGQRYWIARCLRDFPCNPNVVNLNAKLFSSAALEDWWRELHICKDENESRLLKNSMRWATLGYHHDWDTKVYSENMRTEFPKDLGELCTFFTHILGFEDFKAEAAIVNFYPIGTTLSGHTDHSEVNLAAPLLSFSFGQTAIFLIGGKTKDQKPTALYLKSGDLLIMSRDSRLCYHAVPRIMKSQLELWNNPLDESDSTQKGSHAYEELPKPISPWCIDLQLFKQVADETFWMPFRSYLNDSRININVRQVLPSGVNDLSS